MDFVGNLSLSAANFANRSTIDKVKVMVRVAQCLTHSVYLIEYIAAKQINLT